MPQAPFVPRADSKRRPWINNLADRLLQTTTPNYALKYGISTSLVTQLDSGRKWVNWVYDNITVLRNNSQALTQFKDELFTGKGGVTGNLTAPIAPGFSATPVITSIPIIPVADILGFAASIGTMIKKNIIYDRVDGQVMGLEGDELTMPDPATTKPDLGKSHVGSGGRAEIVWPKGPFSAIKLEVDRHDTLGARYLTTDTEPNTCA